MVIIPIREPSVRHPALVRPGQVGRVRLLAEQDQDGEHGQIVAVVQRDLTIPERAGQGGLVAGLELDGDQVGLGTSDPDHLVGGRAESCDIRVDHLDRPARPDPEPFQPGGGVVPDQLFRGDVEAVEVHRTTRSSFDPRTTKNPKNRPDTWFGSFWEPSNFRYQPSEPGHRVIFALIRVSSVFHPWLDHLQIRFRPRMKHGWKLNRNQLQWPKSLSKKY